MDARAILDKLRRGQAPEPAELGWFATALAQGAVDDAQAGAFAMGLCRQELPVAGRVALTLAMRDSGEVLRWDDLPGPVMDKHSTGGVGDPLSLILGPAIAAVGGYIPMLSGRGLGHTGGTLDKLEAIPGLKTEMPMERFRAITAQTGCAIAAASAEIAPADRRLYAVRDVTSTVESLDLITASILSKKLAGGVGPMVFDVKVGSGAFMQDMAAAEALARTLVETANGAAGPAAALITDMSQPCIPAVGNALELLEVVSILTDPAGDPAEELVAALGGQLMQLAGMVETAEAGAAQIVEALASGDAAERFGRMISAMGGPADFVERFTDRLPAAPILREVPAPFDGIVTAVDGRALGQAVVRLGGGRSRAGDKIDPAVGLSDVAQIGEDLEAGEPLAIVHGASEDAAEAIAAELVAAFTLGDDFGDIPALVKARIT